MTQPLVSAIVLSFNRRDETLLLIDYLISHRVGDASVYLAIDTSRGYFLDFARRRLRTAR